MCATGVTCMHLVLLVVGAMMAVAGALLVRSAVPIEDVAQAAWVTGGIVAIVGGIIVAALAAAVRNLGRIAERLDIQPLPLAPVAAVGREDPAPRAVRPPAPPAGPSLLGWLGGRSPAPVVHGKAPPAAAEPAPVDLGPLAQIPEPSRAPPPPPVPAVRPLPRSATSPAAPQNGSPTSASAAVYRSGVIDGMAYTLFMDGSIAAELPQGRVKFATIDELQAYLTGKES